MCAMDDEALTRILDAVGSKFVPADLDRDGLRADIQLTAWWWMQITGEKNQPAKLRGLQDIRRAAEDLKRLLEADDQSGLALSKYPFTGSDPLTVLNQLTNYVDRVLEWCNGDAKTRPFRIRGSAFEWAMQSLMELYPKYFRRKPGISRLGDKIDGPACFSRAASRPKRSPSARPLSLPTPSCLAWTTPGPRTAPASPPKRSMRLAAQKKRRHCGSGMGSRGLRAPSPYQFQFEFCRPRWALRRQRPASPAFAESSPTLAVDLLLIRTVYRRRETVVRGIAVLHCRSALRERRARGG